MDTMPMQTSGIFLILLQCALSYHVPSELGVAWTQARAYRPVDYMVDITNNLAISILYEHNFLNDNNIAFSPYGLTGILIALYEGVDGFSSVQIRDAMKLPLNRDIIRVGFRDIHRRLRSYFIPKEGFLAGLAFNNENVTFRQEYKNILQFYGYDFEMPSPAEKNSSVETVTEQSTQAANTAITQKGETESMTTSAGLTSETTPVTTTTTEMESTMAKEMTDAMTTEPATTILTTEAQTVKQTEVQSTTPEMIGTPASIAQTTVPTESPTTMMDTTKFTNAPETSETIKATSQTTMMTEQSTEASTKIDETSTKIEEISTRIEEISTRIEETSTKTEEISTKIEDTTAPITTEVETTVSTVEMMTETTEMPTIVLDDSTNEVTQETPTTVETRKRRAIYNYDYISPPNPDQFGFIRPIFLTNPGYEGRGLHHQRAFLANGYNRIQITYMTYDSVLEFAYVPYLRSLALKLPLDTMEYYLLILLPEYEFGVNQLVKDLRSERAPTLRQINYMMTNRYVRAWVPTFMLKGFIVLTTDLQKLGVCDAFEPKQDDFKPMTDQKNIYVRNIEQAITVTIRKYMEPTVKKRYAQNQAPVEFAATHPFLYFVMDAGIHVSLMAGKIMNPLNSRIL